MLYSMTIFHQFIRVLSLIKTPFYFFPLGTLPGLIVISILAAFYGSLVGLRLIFKVIFVGPRKFFKADSHRNKPEILKNSQYGVHKIFKLEKIKIHCVCSERKDSQVMLFLHGFPENWFSWRYQLEHFQNEYQTVAMNLRGYGESDKPEGIASYGIDRLVNDVFELVTILIENTRNKKIILVAHDWGASIAWYFAMLYPELIEKLIIMNGTHPNAFRNQIENDWRQFFSSWYMFFFQLPLLPELMIRSFNYEMIDKLFKKNTRNEEELEIYKYYYNSLNDLTAPLNYYRAILRGYGRPELIEKLAHKKKSNEIEVPTLIIWGKNDNALMTDLAASSAQFCRNPTLKILDGSHWIPFEKPHEVNKLMRDFL
ncbi:Epoxide hydrolase 3 [Sarcoptes scabiei]|uniref:Epoxide hydrolase 3 n=1 Tax=Sarcoptes scabiei TaxID=52283 RepID=A0A834RF42_SARSC|nr:Epoxide hydrolase 3 [Sarcoptes scabiei]UXI16432.1 excitatory amino acid transporter [Sarcoptes scabiei]